MVQIMPGDVKSESLPPIIPPKMAPIPKHEIIRPVVGMSMCSVSTR